MYEYNSMGQCCNTIQRFMVIYIVNFNDNVSQDTSNLVDGCCTWGTEMLGQSPVFAPHSTPLPPSFPVISNPTFPHSSHLTNFAVGIQSPHQRALRPLTLAPASGVGGALLISYTPPGAPHHGRETGAAVDC